MGTLSALVTNIANQERQTTMRVPRYAEEKLTAGSSGFLATYDGAGYQLTDMTSAIAQGLGDNQRAGDQIHLTRLFIKVNFLNQDGLGTNLNTTYRVCVFQWMNTSLTLPVIANLFLPSNMNGGNVEGAYSFRNIDRIKQVNMLFDSDASIYTTGSASLAPNGSVGGPQIFQMRSWEIPLTQADRNIQYYAAGVDGPNHIFLLITTDQANNAAANPLCAYGFCLRFLDA